MTQTVLVLGGGGAVGSGIAAEAIHAGHQVHVSMRAGGNRSRLPALAGAEAHTCDLGDDDAVLRLISSVNPHLIVMAALPQGHPAITDAARAKYINDIMRLQLALFRALKLTEYRGRLVLIGSSTLYGGGLPRNPDGPAHPQSLRGVAKGAERLMAEFLALEQGRRLIELRVFAAYGRWMSPKRLLTRLLRAALDGSRVAMGDAPFPRDWIHHTDIGRAALACMNLPTEAGLPITINMCSGELIASRKMAERLQQICGRELIADEVRPGTDWMGEVLPGVPPAAGELPGWSRQVDVDAGLADLWQWARTREGRTYLMEEAA